MTYGATASAAIYLELTLSLFVGVAAFPRLCVSTPAWETAQAQKPDSLDFQDNWDEDANDKDFVAQLRKELSK